MKVSRKRPSALPGGGRPFIICSVATPPRREPPVTARAIVLLLALFPGAAAGGPPPEFADVTRPTLAGVVADPAVGRELKLTPAQRDQLAAGATADEAKYRAAVKAVTTGDPLAARAELQTVAASAAASAVERVTRILDPGQVTRLRQIDRQARGTAALLDPDVQAELAVTAAQKAKLSALTDDYDRQLSRLKRAAGGAVAGKTIPGTDHPAGRPVGVPPGRPRCR